MDNFVQFEKVNVFQAGVMSLLSGLMASEREIDKTARIFKELDTNNDGRLSQEELEQAFKSIMPQDKNAFHTCFEAADMDKDGYLDFHEFMSATMDRRSILKKGNINKIFNTFDQN